MKRRIGILTSGGDCPGLNACIRGVARASYSMFDAEIIGIQDGYAGLIAGDYKEMKQSDFSGILTLGGTILGTRRTPFRNMRVVSEDGVDKVKAMKANYKKMKLDCLVTLGGNGTHKTANLLAEEGLNVIGLPKTIDNDIYGTDVTFGFHTAVDIVYTPSCTKFMKMVQAAGGKAINGLDMLLYQGLIAFELWNPEVKVDKDTIDRIREMILDHLHGNTRKHNVIFTGFMGAGKTSAGHFYADHYHMPFIDTDQEIEKEAGMAISQIFKEQGEEAFRKLETQCLEKLLRTTVISVGGGLPLREENRELLKKLGLVVYLDVSPETVYKRIGADVSSRPMLHSDDVPGRIRSLLNERRPLYLKAAHVAVDVNDRSLDAITEEIYREAHK